MSEIETSAQYWERARQVMPGGVSSPVRAFKAVGGDPPYIARGKGAYLWDVEGNEYIDYVGSYGPALFGHAPAFLEHIFRHVAANGTTYGAPTSVEVALAELVCELVPSAEMVRFVNSGSEATTSAVRLARGATGRSKIIKCSGCFHGSVDSLLAKAGSGVATLGIPETAGVTANVAADTLVIDYNNVDQLEEAFNRFGNDIAAFILEPVAANMGLVLPTDGYLQKCREITSKYGALLIFDEVISGFRLAMGGAQQIYGVIPDITCLGKIIGGGIPCGAYCGRTEIMSLLAPEGPVYQAGTLSGNPLAMAAGYATLAEIRARGLNMYHDLEALTKRFATDLIGVFSEAGVPVRINQKGSLLTAFLCEGPVTDYDSAKKSNTEMFARLFHGLLDQGIYTAPAQYEALFVSVAHNENDVDRTLEGYRRALAKI